MKNAKFKRTQTAFTLVEMAIVLALIGLILGTGLTLLSAQQEQRKVEETNALLSDAREALIGFAIARGRLPCPASSTSNGVEDPNTGGFCNHPYDGFLPSVTLGLPGVDANGYLMDAWRLPQNRIRYAVTTDHSNAATTTDGIKSVMPTFSPDLNACASATGITATTCGTATTLSSNAVAVIYSLGKNAPTGGTSVNEAANLNGDPVFVSHALATVDETDGYFDDQVIWLSPNILFNRMVQAGRLP